MQCFLLLDESKIYMPALSSTINRLRLTRITIKRATSNLRELVLYIILNSLIICLWLKTLTKNYFQSYEKLPHFQLLY